MSDVPRLPPVGAIHDGDGNVSSKRLESFIGLAAAILCAGVGYAIKETVLTPVLVGAFLGYSMSMQGVSAYAERNMMR
jgi:hypothetical protein